MRRLEPRDEGVGLARDFAKTHEGLHLVGVAAHRLGQLRCGAGIRIGDTRQQMRLAVGDAPRDPVKQGVTHRVAMTQHRAGQFEKRSGNVRRRAYGRRIGQRAAA